jgi:hypothetical protein
MGTKCAYPFITLVLKSIRWMLDIDTTIHSYNGYESKPCAPGRLSRPGATVRELIGRTQTISLRGSVAATTKDDGCAHKLTMNV